QAFRMKNIVLAASTFDGGLFTPMSDFLNRLAAKTLRNRRVALIENGSWAPQAARLMSATLSTMKNIEIISPTITVQTAPDSETENVLRQLADNLLA
ncbi:MAG: FprA family A-type flavoprotein, partial [Paramuribaculum sp.]|nr:FprA family A-type flavoprotein [Paramuribaculum sp.]